MKVRWAQEALNDRNTIWDYLSARNPVAAVETDESFSNAIAALTEQPELGVMGKIAGTREWLPHRNYRLIYEYDAASQTLSILTIIHTARLWPPVSQT